MPWERRRTVGAPAALLGERLAEAFTMRHRTEGLAFLLAPPDPVRGMTERQDCEHIERIRDREQPLHLREPPEAHPIGPDASGPGGSTIDWIARLASETPNCVCSTATTIAGGACAI